MKKASIILSVLGLLLVTILLSCDNQCDTELCPSECVNISLAFFKNGENILESDPDTYSIDNVKIESIAGDQDTSSTLRIGSSTFSFAACKGGEYRLYLSNSEIIEISATMDISEVVSSNTCCTYYAPSTIALNDSTFCSDIATCSVTQKFEL